MKESEVFSAVVKFMNHASNGEELDRLVFCLKDGNYGHVVYQAVKTHYLITLSMNDFDLAEAKEAVKRKLAAKKRKRWMGRVKRLVAAASLVVAAAVFYFLQVESGAVDSTTSSGVAASSKSTSNGILLTLETGEQVTLGKGQGYQEQHVYGNGENLVYNQGDAKTKESFHVLTVPKAEQFFVQLADGTKVWLNADSKMRYPTSFGGNPSRKVELIHGEAYFEVNPHKIPFIVQAGGQEVKVLGTAFNIKAYADDPTVSTTLVKGKVMVRKEARQEVLHPNQQSVVNKAVDDIRIQAVDAAQYISWISGFFTFENANLEDVMKTLSRWYDMDIVYANHGAQKFVFTGVLERSKSIGAVLAMIEATSVGDVRFEVTGNTVFVN